jgi:acyl-CoA thioester hydrolase
MSYTVDFKTKWSDFDPNRHMRHTAYNDYAAEARARFFISKNFSIEEFTKYNIGPILFHEETFFRKEIHMGEDISVNLKIAGLSANNERWKLTHEIFNQQGKLSAIIKVTGAWLDLTKRKLASPPKEANILFQEVEKTADFEEIIMSKK